jgi:hypothetical protein
MAQSVFMVLARGGTFGLERYEVDGAFFNLLNFDSWLLVVQTAEKVKFSKDAATDST